jgi:eukaryotic-like serine/threonine-protein kinase
MTSDADNLERRVLILIEEVLEQAPDMRRDYLLAKTPDDPELRARAQSILDAGGGPTPVIATGGAREYEREELIPKIIGAYRIEREIGRGGMGAVYFGRRVTEDFDHVAAIKVVRADAMSPRLIERLRAERRTLARLKHHNIAQMYDGGETADGAPYFVMEFVAGTPLDEYLSVNNASMEERLKLFLDICDAVSFAHRNLIIHRDLSPSNMLVSNDRRVKLIDFGIAHSLAEDATMNQLNSPKTTMTKGYAAPERLDGVPASTVTDVYSLGVILEEMTADLDAPRNADLAAIAAKAGAETPDARYQSVDALAKDITAYQRGAPVAAVDGGWTYTFARFVGRRKVAVGAGALAIVTMVATSIIMSVLFVRAVEAERQAVQRFDEVRELAGFIMFDFHDEVAKLEGSTLVREKLVKTALDYLDTLSETPRASTALKVETARGYKRLSEVTGSAGFTSIGHRAEASALLKKAAAQIADIKQTDTQDPSVLSAFIEITFAQGIEEGISNNDFERGIALLREVQDTAAILTERGAASLEVQLSAAYSDAMVGYFLRFLHRFDEAIAQINTGIDKYQAIVSDNPENNDAQLGLARANVSLGEVMAWRIYFTEGDYEVALPFFDRGIERIRRLLTEPNPILAEKTGLVISLLKRANTTCYMENRGKEGVADLNEAAALAEELIARDSNNDHIDEQLTHIMIQKVECYYNLGLVAEAVRDGKVAVARREAKVAAEPSNLGFLKELANVWSVITWLYVEEDDWPNACSSAKRLAETWQRYGELQTVLNESNRLEQEGGREVLAKCAERGLP